MKFFPKMGGHKRKGDGSMERPDPESLEDEIMAEMQREAEEEEVYNETEKLDELEEEEEEDEEYEEEFCDDEEATASTPTPEEFPGDFSANNGTSEITDGGGTSLFGRQSTLTALSVTLVVALLGWNLVFRRKQRRKQRRWKRDSQSILHRVDDVMLQLEARDEEVDVLQQKIKVIEGEAKFEQERLAKESSEALQAKENECQELKAIIAELQGKQKESDILLEKAAEEIKHIKEGQQDHDCQLLEQKLQASQLSTALEDRDKLVEELQQTNTKLQQKIKSDSMKAEDIIGNLTKERDGRYEILQQENEAIKNTIMGMLKQTQESYDADKIVLKKEMRKRDDRIKALQMELWQSNAVLKRLQEDKGATENFSQSFRTLIQDIKETREVAANSGGKDSALRRSSTYDAAERILEAEEKCEELKQLETMLQKSNTFA